MLFTATALLAISPSPAAAVDLPSPGAWVTDGRVNTIVPDASGRLYVGGDFVSFGPRLGHGLQLTLDSDVPAANVPDINGTVLASAPDGAGGVFIGGSFTYVGGVARNRLAHLLADGTLDPNWNPNANNTVRALAVVGDSVFVGGDFGGSNAIGGGFRQFLAKVSASTGGVDTSWPGHASNTVKALVASGGKLYVATTGSLVDTNPAAVSRLGRFDIATGLVDAAWNPAPNNTVTTLAVGASDVYVAGTFSSVGGQSRAGLAKLAVSGAGAADATWDPSPGGPVTALLLDGADLYAGGDPVTIGGQPRQTLAKLATTGLGAADPTWNPTVSLLDSSKYEIALAKSGSSLLVGGDVVVTNLGTNLVSVSTAGAGAALAWHPQPNAAVRTITLTGGNGLFAGGEFTSAGPSLKPTGSLVRLNADGTLDSSWLPLTLGPVNAIASDGANVYVGGNFGFFNNNALHNLAKIPVGGDGTPDAAWHPNPTQSVNALVLSGTDLYAGGDFHSPDPIGGLARDRLAKLSTSGAGDADPSWNPAMSTAPSVQALALSGSDLYAAAGDVLKISAAGTGTIDAAWQPGVAGAVNSLVLAGSDLYIGGAFTNVGGLQRLRVAKVSATGTGAVDSTWDPSANAPVHALAVSGDNLFLGGEFSQLGASNPPLVNRNRAGRVALSTGVPDSYDLPPSINGGAVFATAVAPNRILVGGDFDSLGTLSTSHFALFDLQPPTLQLDVPVDGARYRQGQVVNADFTCADPSGESGLSCVGSSAAGTPIDTNSAGTKSFTATATDRGGNAVSKTVSYTVDGSAPAVTITQPAEGARYVIGSNVRAAYSCVDPDGDADVASCVGPVPAGVAIDTSTAGQRTFTVSSTDVVGNTEAKSVAYTITKPTTRPIISALKITPSAFRAAGKGKPTAARKVPVGGKVTYRLSLAASVTFKVTRKKGRKTITAGTFKLKGKNGSNKFTFRGRLRQKKLRPGNYRLIAQAIGPTGLRSVTVARSFKILTG